MSILVYIAILSLILAAGVVAFLAVGSAAAILGGHGVNCDFLKEVVTKTIAPLAIVAIGAFLLWGVHSPSEEVVAHAKGGDSYYSLIIKEAQSREGVDIKASIESTTGAGWYYSDLIQPGEVRLILEYESNFQWLLKEVMKK